MKKVLFSALILGLVFTTSCNKDDDGGSKKDCKTCDLTAQGTTVTSKFCDNEDGTIEVTTGGQTQTQDLNGVTFEQFIAAYEQLGATCN
jgi:hypothetical protein